MTPAERFGHVEALAERGLLEFAVVDPGSVNFTTAITTADARPAFTYLNPEAHVRHALGFAARKGFHPAFAIYEPGFTRAGAALARATGVKTPVSRFMFSGTSPSAFRQSPMRWRPTALLGGARPRAVDDCGPRVDVRPLIGETVARGGHVRVGLEDAPMGTQWAMSPGSRRPAAGARGWWRARAAADMRAALN